MRLITIALLCFLSFNSIGQECGFLPSDTVVCGFKHNLQLTDETGDFFYNCEQAKSLSIANSSDGSTMFSFSECGEYEVIFESSVDGCLDTFRIQVYDPSNSTTSVMTNVDLGYGDIDCPDGVVADCWSDGVSIPIASGTPEPIWSFCTTISCQSNIYSTEVIGDINGCLADSIACDSISISDFSEECIDTNQDAFIVLNGDGDMVDSNTFLEYIAQLQSDLNIDCPLITNNCLIQNEGNCIDSTVIDTSYLPIPVRIGGKWTLANIDSVELFDTTYFEYLNRDYELILDPGVEFYGPGNLDVYLYELFISSSNDTTRNFPYGFHLELQWEEDWILDTLEIIREIPFDTDGDCFACGGNFFNSGFDVPGIPEFPCRPVSIDYPDICQCEEQYPDYSIQLINCEPKEWQVDIFGGFFEIIDVYGAQYSIGGGNMVLLTQPTSENVTIVLSDWNGCYYEITVNLESIAEDVRIETNGNPYLTCAIHSVLLHAEVFASNNLILDFHEPPTWYLPNGEVEIGLTLSATEPGAYRLEYQDELGCIHEDIIDIVYNDEIFYHQESEAICGSDGIEYEGMYIDEAGVYTIELHCDEYVILTVHQFDNQEYDEYYEVCQGESMEVHGHSLTPGIHVLSLPNGTPCADVVHVEIIEVQLDISYSVTQTCDGLALLSLTHSGSGGSYSILNNGSTIGDYVNSGNSLEVELETSGLYEVSVESNGCTSSIIVDVALQEYSILPHEEGLIDCDNNCAVLTPEIINLRGESSATDYSIIWNGPNGFTSSEPIVEVCDGGMYNVRLEYGNDCSVNQDIMVNENLEPEVLYINADLCFGECYDDGTYTFCESTQTIIDVDDCMKIEVDVKIAEAINAERLYTICEGESIQIDDVLYEEEGDYEEVFVAEGGCDSTLNFSIEVLERGEVYSDNIIDCLHDEAMINYTPLNDNETYVWRDENGTVVSNEVNYLAVKPGIYTIEVSIEGHENTCTFIEEFEVLEHMVYPEIILEDVYTINCEPTARVEFNMEEGSTWEWRGSSSDLYIENQVLETDIADAYVVLVTNEEGCTASKSIEITKVEPLEIEVSTIATCEGLNEGKLQLNNIQGGMAPYTIMLDGEVIESDSQNLSEGDYTLSILQSDGCIHEQEVRVESIPDLDEMDIQYLEYCNAHGIKITLNLTDQLTYKWLDGFDSHERQITKEGVYDVEISNGCSTVISTYDVEDTRVDQRFLVSNIFSPDGNSTNDKMKVVPQVEVQDFKLYIFSRDGSLVFESTDPDVGWDGRIGGHPVVIGSYVWMIESRIADCDGVIEKTQDVGTVMVIY